MQHFLRKRLMTVCIMYEFLEYCAMIESEEIFTSTCILNTVQWLKVRGYSLQHLSWILCNDSEWGDIHLIWLLCIVQWLKAKGYSLQHVLYLGKLCNDWKWGDSHFSIDLEYYLLCNDWKRRDIHMYLEYCAMIESEGIFTSTFILNWWEAECM